MYPEVQSGLPKVTKLYQAVTLLNDYNIDKASAPPASVSEEDTEMAAFDAEVRKDRAKDTVVVEDSAAQR